MLDWMVGSWAGSRSGVEMEEHWTEARGGLMLGLHRDVLESGSTFFEYLRIEVGEDGEIDYVASPRGGQPTRFRMIGVADGRAIFSNPVHDHPKRIVYRLDDEGRLCARVEGVEDGNPRSAQWCWERLVPDPE